MNLTRQDSLALVRGIVSNSQMGEHVELAVCPPSVYLDAVSGVVADTDVSLGAQNMYHEPSGAFTGEISAAMLMDLGCKYVILGHSERRHILGETDAMVNQKAFAALEAGLQPIVCVGETLQQRESGSTGEVIRQQFEGRGDRFGDQTQMMHRQLVLAHRIAHEEVDERDLLQVDFAPHCPEIDATNPLSTGRQGKEAGHPGTSRVIYPQL